MAAIFEAIVMELEPHGFKTDPAVTPEGVVATLIAKTLATLPTSDRTWLRENDDTWGREDLKEVIDDADLTDPSV